MDNTNIAAAPAPASLRADVLHKPGAVRIDAYPLLVYAPLEHGPGIRTEDKGVEVASIAAKADGVPDHAALAAHFNTTAEHVRQALAYAVAVGAISPIGEKPATPK